MTTALQLEKVREERTYHREIDINLRHRCWGVDVPATGLNFIETQGTMPIAIITYKRKQNNINYMAHTLAVHGNLAAMSNLPHLLVEYDFNTPTPTFHIMARNLLARKTLTGDGIGIEPFLVRVLHLLRNKTIIKSDAEIQAEIEKRWKEIK